MYIKEMSPEVSDSIILLFSDAMRHLYPEASYVFLVFFNSV